MSPKAPVTPQLALLFGVAPEESAEPAPRRNRARRTWLVHQLVSEAREIVEHELGDVWVEGEISNLRPAASGHLYFTLKDAEAQLPVVLFRRQALLLRFRPEDGLHVRVRGKVTIYEQRGQLQLVAETMEPVGAGSLQLAFEQLRERLKTEGLFDQERKQALPSFPRTVAVITSPTGAVIRDFLNIVGRRHSGLSVLIVPVSVQGDAAPLEIEAAVRLVNDDELADIIVLARGGGSLEDLSAFNSERVARAIAASNLPVVSAVGHETDFTIADFVADLRAPTPSAAAELITEAQHNIAEYLATLAHRLDRAVRFQMMHAHQRYTRLPAARMEQRMTTLLYRLEQRVDELGFRLESAIAEVIRSHRKSVADCSAAVLRHDPRRQLSAARETLSSSQSRLFHALDRSLASAGYRRRTAEARLFRAIQVRITHHQSRFAALRGQLQSLSPIAVLQRGYALVQDENGQVIRSIERLAAGQAISTRLSDGIVTSRIESTQSAVKKKERQTKS